MLSGSENNSLYLYYKGLSKTLLTFKFDTVKSVLDKDRKEDDTNEFVSAVCWRALPDGESNVLIAANSQGTIKVLELVWRVYVVKLYLILLTYICSWQWEKTELSCHVSPQSHHGFWIAFEYFFFYFFSSFMTFGTLRIPSGLSTIDVTLWTLLLLVVWLSNFCDRETNSFEIKINNKK